MQMDQTTQQNSALVEESAAASESLREQAEKLTQVVSVFRVAAQPASAYGAPTAPVAVRQPKAPQPATAAARTPEEPLQVKRLASAGTGGDWEEF
jgi:methyl-accepting chemotaxis protein